MSATYDRPAIAESREDRIARSIHDEELDVMRARGAEAWCRECTLPATVIRVRKGETYATCIIHMYDPEAVV